MSSRCAALAVPGDITTLTGGYIYDRHLLDGLRRLGRDVALLELGTSFPNPTADDIRDAAKRLAALPPDRPVIIDGLALGSIERFALEGIAPPIVAMIHHPLAYENGVSAAQRDQLFRTERDNLELAAHVLVPSAHTAKMLVSDYGLTADRITIARPGTERPAKFRRTSVDPPLILAVGIQVPRKGHDTLLKALALLIDHPWQAVIAGGEHNRDHAAKLSELVEKLGLTGRVRIAGRVPGEDLAHLYSQASVFALATRYEGYGIVFDEAMAHGLPIVTCKVGAVPETVAPGAGLLVAPDDPSAFAKALSKVIGDADLRAKMAAASVRAGEALPGWESTVRVVDRVLDQAASKSASDR